MSVSPEARKSDLFDELAEQIYGKTDPQAIYTAIVHKAVELVDGCEHASLMVKTNGKYVTVGYTDEVALLIDNLERQVGEGPCVDAIEEEGIQSDPDLREHSSWPDLAALVLAETPVRGMLGIRLRIDDRKAGALNLFADEANALVPESIDQAAIIGSFASIAMMALSARDQAETLTRGLDSNREIGKAMGLLMAAHKFSEDEAFELLKRTSQNLNMKLAQVARKVVEGQQHQYPAT